MNQAKVSKAIQDSKLNFYDHHLCQQILFRTIYEMASPCEKPLTPEEDDILHAIEIQDKEKAIRFIVDRVLALCNERLLTLSNLARVGDINSSLYQDIVYNDLEKLETQMEAK